MGYKINDDGSVTRFENDNNSQTPQEELGCLGLLCSFLFPIIGVIIYFNQKDKVNNASYYQWAAGASFVIGLIISAIG